MTPGFSMQKCWRRRSGSDVDAVVIEGLVIPFFEGGRRCGRSKGVPANRPALFLPRPLALFTIVVD